MNDRLTTKEDYNIAEEVKGAVTHLKTAKQIVSYALGLYGKWYYALVAFIALVLWHHCDYLIQAKWFGWDAWVTLSSSGTKWPFLVDWIFPKDSWHFVQTLRSWFLGIAALFFAMALAYSIVTRLYKWHHFALILLAFMLMYWVARGPGFSLFYMLYN